MIVLLSWKGNQWLSTFVHYKTTRDFHGGIYSSPLRMKASECWQSAKSELSPPKRLPCQSCTNKKDGRRPLSTSYIDTDDVKCSHLEGCNHRFRASAVKHSQHNAVSQCHHTTQRERVLISSVQVKSLLWHGMQSIYKCRCGMRRRTCIS